MSIILHALLVALLALPVMAAAAPATPAPATGVPEAPPIAAAPVAVPVLRALVFLNDPAQVQRDGWPHPETGLNVSRVPYLNDPDFLAAVRPLLGKPVNLAALNAMTPQVVRAFTARHHPAVQLAIPEQDIGSGVVQVLVTEFHVGQVRVEGNEWSPDALILRGFSLRAGDPIDDTVLAEDVRHLNRNQFRSVQSILRPGEAPGSTDIVLATTDRLPMAVTAGYNNNGVPSTGRDQWSAGISAGNVLGSLDDVLGYQLTSSNFLRQRPLLLTHTGSYALDMPGIGSFSLTGVYSTTRPPEGTGLTDLGQTGQLSLRYNRDLPDFGALQSTLVGGYDYKTTNTNIAFGGSTISTQFSDVSQFVLGAQASRADGWGQSDGSITVFLSPGEMTPNNNSNAFAATAPGAQARYAYARLDLSRTTQLPAGLRWWTHMTAQVSSGNLLSSEELTIGGADTVRGYPTATARGDEGVVLNNELRLGPWPIWRVAIEPHLFWDYAHVIAAHPEPLQAVGGTLSSIGPGARINLDRYVNLALDAGAQIRIDGKQSHPGQFAHIGLNLGY